MIERVVVTGASNGIGAACVDAFRDLGADVIGVDKEPESKADDHLTLDLSTPACGQTLLKHLGGRPVDVLVNNAAVGFALEATETDVSIFDRVIAVNLRAPFLLAAALHPTLADRSGVVVNVASVHAVVTSGRVSVVRGLEGWPRLTDEGSGAGMGPGGPGQLRAARCRRHGVVARRPFPGGRHPRRVRRQATAA